MKERKETEQPVRSAEVRSSDIKNAHAAGDGAMGRNDEKLDDEEKIKSGGNEKPDRKDITAY